MSTMVAGAAHPPLGAHQPFGEHQPFGGPLARLWGDDAGPDRLLVLLDRAADRLPVAPSTDRAAWAAADAANVRDVGVRAHADRGSAWPQPLVSQYARFFRDGDRTEYEGVVGARQRRLSRAALLAAAATDARARASWLDDVIDGVVLLCEQSSWSWGAHDDTFTANGFVVPLDSRPYLDLGAGEVVAQLAWIDGVLGAAIDERAPGVRRRIRDEAMHRVFRPFVDRRDWHWIGLDGDVHNWNPWIHGNVILAAVALLGDESRVNSGAGTDSARLRAHVVSLAIEGLDRYVASLPADGAIDEGFSYWWNGAARLLEALEIVSSATGGVLDGGDLPVVRELLRFPHRMHVGGDWYVNVADGPARAGSGKPWQVAHRWGSRLDDADVVAHAASAAAIGATSSGRDADAARLPAPLADESAGLGRLLLAVLDVDWRRAVDSAPVAPLVGGSWSPSVEVLVARQEAGTARGLTLSAKGGHNGEHHNHLDVGSFTVAVDGVPVVVDAGQPTYTAQTFGPHRYDIRAMRSGWHNVPAPFGIEQGAGDRFAASAVSPIGYGSGLVLDLAGAYPVPPGTVIDRRIELVAAVGGAAGSPSADGVVRVTDTWDLVDPRARNDVAAPDAPERGMLLHLLLAGDVSLSGAGSGTGSGTGASAVVRPRDGGRGARILWSCPDAEASLETWTLDDPLLELSWGRALTRLTLAVPRTSAQNITTIEVHA